MSELRLRNRSLEWRLIEDEVIVLDVQLSRYLATNPAGALLWRMLAEGSTISALSTALAEAFDLPLEDARADTQAFVEALQAEGLLGGNEHPAREAENA